MAKKSMIARERVRLKLSCLGLKRREKLRSILKNPNADYDEKLAAMIKLNKRPRDESHVRVQRRCRSCGRPRAVYRKFELCRICLRNVAMHGDVPGLLKASW